MNKQTKEELEIGQGWEILCTPAVGALYECIDGSGLIVKCNNRRVSGGMFGTEFGGKVINDSNKHIDCHKNMNYSFLRNAFKLLPKI